MGALGDSVGKDQEETLERGPEGPGVGKGTAFTAQASPEEGKGTSPWRNLHSER